MMATAQLPADHLRKLSPHLRQQQGWVFGPATHPARFLLYCTDLAGLKDLIAAAPDSAVLTYAYGQVVSIAAYPQWVLRRLLSLPTILYIDGNDRKAKEEVVIPGFDYTTNHINTAHDEYPALDGGNIVVSVKEDCPDTTDIDFRGRFQPLAGQSPRVSAHATIMGTIIAGAGNSFYTARGVAPDALLTSSSFDQLLPDKDEDYRYYHISVQNHSYGTGIENYYGADAAAYDASVINNPTLLHVFSSGNSGDQADSIGSYKRLSGWANLTGSFKMAKNILTVGSIDSFYRVPLLSSKGPAYDGRIKPELVAYGEDGSSGAAALVSGAALLLQQAYQQQHKDSLPAAALVKAFLLNSAGGAGSGGIDFVSGFGSLDVWRAIHEVQAGHFFSGTASRGEERQFSLQLPAGARRLKVLLCWSDPPAMPNAATALVNDLDLRLAHITSSQEWLPWVLNGAPDKDSLSLLPVRKRDSLNNEEQITVDTPADGRFLISVRSTVQGQDSQSFYVVYQWDTAGFFRWMYPTATDNLLPGEANTLRWQTMLTSGALLEYQLAGEGSWKKIGEVPASPGLSPQLTALSTDGYLSWSPPDTTALALLRMTIDGQSHVSDTFTISPRLLTGVGFNCPDSFLLYWNRSTAGAYTLYHLGDRYLETEQILTDTSILLPAAPSLAGWYAIAPLLQGHRAGLKSYAFDYTQQGVGCYISNFTADLIGAGTALQLDLGTGYRVVAVALEKWSPAGYRTLAAFGSPAELHYAATDDSLTQGVNAYRARVVLDNGQTLYSDLQTIYFTGGRSFFVYPNPVYRPQSIHILAENLNNPVFRLFNASGQVLMEKRLTQLLEDIPTSSLSAGFYFYWLQTPDGKTFRGKVIVL